MKLRLDKITIDGMEHVRGDTGLCEICCDHICRKCGGIVHGQPVYGGIAYSCENCDDEWDALPHIIDGLRIAVEYRLPP